MTASTKTPCTASTSKIELHESFEHYGRSVLEKEAAALLSLSKTLGDAFTQAVQAIRNIKGRLIVSGMGKSGHIARKIAATMASTGQPAFFVHAAEAGHGDLGMVTPEDGVLMLSFSGETQELKALISYTHRFNIPMIGMTKNPNSALAQYATIPLILPDEEEACPMGLAPTTSTTMMLALGDALAVSLLQSRQFSPKDYSVFHPGGSLGEQLTTVGDRMHKGRDLPCVLRATPLHDVISVMTDKQFGCAGVVDETGCLVGMITDGDLRRLMAKRTPIEGTAAHDIMNTHPKTVTPNLLMADALRIMQEKSITSLFIVDEHNTPIGLVHIHDFLKRGVI